MQTELTRPGPLLDADGRLAQVGWSRQPLLDCNLEQAKFYPGVRRPFQRFRMKRWDYYAIFTPQRFFSATIADLGYAGNIFVYTMEWGKQAVHEEGLVIPLGWGVQLPRNSQQGDAHFSGQGARLDFRVRPGGREVSVDWPAFDHGRGVHAEIQLACPDEHESMTIVIPIAGKRFYYNRKINCMPATGWLEYEGTREEVDPRRSLGSLDWGRGVWAYQSYWNWASASGFLPDGRTVGLNLGCGFGDTSAATENCLILNGRLHKLDQVKFDYTSGDYKKPWRFIDAQGRLELKFTPFLERLAQTDMKIIFSQVHQMFGTYMGKVIADDGEVIQLEGLVGFAEEHQARW